MVDDEVGRRRDAAATKASLLSAARELFNERGFDHTTVRDIAGLAGVNQALLFRYFGSKEALFRVAMTSQGHQLLAETPPEQLVGRMLTRMLSPDAASVKDNPIYALLRSTGNEHTAAVFRDDLGEPYRRALAALTDADDARVRADLVLAWLLGIGLLRSVLDEDHFAGVDPAQVTAHVLRAVATLLERVDQRPPPDA
ncbi:MAG TPA: TetR family transcriptional regulator [Pseudonocardiaceae bacterium]|nr:TetR family transcriptional regulator [Pseudonocardiaceae bacterium]